MARNPTQQRRHSLMQMAPPTPLRILTTSLFHKQWFICLKSMLTLVTILTTPEAYSSQEPMWMKDSSKSKANVPRLQHYAQLPITHWYVNGSLSEICERTSRIRVWALMTRLTFPSLAKWYGSGVCMYVRGAVGSNPLIVNK